MPSLIILLQLTAMAYALHRFLNCKIFARVKHVRPRQDPEPAKSGSSDLKAMPTHALSFPPSRRHTLPGLNSVVSETLPESKMQTTQYTKLLPDKQLTDPAIHHDHITATGITLREIQQLGDFPDYATLSGVPLPEPYPAFDVKKAMPRPYRPFRWAYHQTMCKCICVSP